MTNEVVTGVAKAIKAAFPSVPVYTEKVDQGIEEPSFVIRCFRNQHGRFRGQRSRKTHSIEVQYFPPETNRRSNANAVEEALFQALELITAGSDTVRGQKMDAHMDDSYTVIFTVDYDYFVIETETSPDLMETLDEEVTIDEEDS